MNFLRHRYQSWLVPYVEGTLDAHRCAKLEAQIRRDPSLAAEAEAHRRAAARVREMSHAVESEPDTAESTLWPAIQVRLKPRRGSMAPLVLAGGLCAAACVLAFVSLHGSLGSLSNSALPSTAISNRLSNDQLGMTANRKLDESRRKHYHHAPRRVNTVMAERPKTHKPANPSSSNAQESAPVRTDNNLASAGANATDLGAIPKDNYPAPRFAVGTAGHFRLAPLVRPLNSDPGASQILPELRDRPSVVSAAPAHNVDSSAAQPSAAANLPQATAADSQPDVALVAQAKKIASHHATHRRRHRRRRLTGHRPAKAASVSPSDSSTTAPSASDSASSTVDAPTGLKVKPCLID